MDTSEKNHFWQFNIGHVLVMIGMLGGFMWSSGVAVTQFANMRSEIVQQREAITDLRTSMGEVRVWRDHESDQQSNWRNQVSEQFAEIQRHLDHLDYEMGQRTSVRASPSIVH